MMEGIWFMPNDKSLVSLALLKTNWEDQQKDSIDMLIPFVLYSISHLKCNDIVSIEDTKKKLQINFGIELYSNVVELILKRLASNKHFDNPYLYRAKSVFYRTDQNIETEKFEQNQKKFEQNQNDVLKYFLDYLNERNISFDTSDAKNELISYLCKYGHNIIQDNLMLHENTIWTKRIGEFIQYLYESNANIFDYLKDIAKGGMISAVYFNEHREVKLSRKFKNTEIYLDTPLLMFILNYSGDALQTTVQELVNLLYQNGASVCTFEHNLIELEGILGAYINRYKNGTLNTSYNFDYLIENDVKPEKIETDILSLRYMLKNKKIFVKDTPNYDDYWKNVEEENFNKYLSTKIHYAKDDRRDNDVASITAIYRLRDRSVYYKYESCKALFVATNSYLVYHTQKYFKEQEHRKGIPAIVDDTFLTSLLWLKSIKKDNKLPTLKLVVDALAAQEPSKKFWENFIEKVNELKDNREITDEELIELKYGLFSAKNMFDVTEGDTNKITHETVKKVQQMNFRMQHKSIIEENNMILNEKEKALVEKNQYQKKYSEEHNELIETKSQPYLKQINRMKGFYNILGIIVVSIIIYFIVDWITGVSGILSNTNFVINIGATALIIAVFAIINLFIDKYITNQADKISLHFLNKYIQKVYNSIYLKDDKYASEIIAFIDQNIKKDT